MYRLMKIMIVIILKQIIPQGYQFYCLNLTPIDLESCLFDFFDTESNQY